MNHFLLNRFTIKRAEKKRLYEEIKVSDSLCRFPIEHHCSYFQTKSGIAVVLLILDCQFKASCHFIIHYLLNLFLFL